MTSDSLRRIKWGDVAPIPETDADAESVSLTTAASRILGPNPNRVQVFLVNDTANVVRVRWNAAPTTTLGYPVGPNGGTLRFSYEQDGERVFGELQGIASAASTIFVAADEMPAASRVRKVA